MVIPINSNMNCKILIITRNHVAKGRGLNSNIEYLMFNVSQGILYLKEEHNTVEYLLLALTLNPGAGLHLGKGIWMIDYLDDS